MNLEEILYQVISGALENKNIGVIVNGINDLNITSLLNLINNNVQEKHYISVIDYDLDDTNYSNLEVFQNIEKAVEWRSTPECANKIVVIVKNDTAKMHSLAEFLSITTRDVSVFLVDNCISNSSNTPIRNFWEAIKDNIVLFPYILLADFCKNADCNEANSMLDNMWRLGLIKDKYLFDPNKDTTFYLLRNLDVLHQMAQLNDVSRRRLTSSLAKSSGQDQSMMKKTHDLILEYFKFGKKSTLKELDMKYVEKLLLASKSNKTSKTKPKKPAKDETESVIKPKDFIEMVDRDFVENNGETSEGIKKCLESLRDYYNSMDDEDFDSTSTIQVSIDDEEDKTLAPQQRENELISLISQFCSNDNWGGKIISNEDSVNSILIDENADFHPFNINSTGEEQSDLLKYGGFISFGYNGDTLEQILERFDVDLKARGFDSHFSQAFGRIKQSRDILANNINLVLYYPTLLFSGDQDVKNALFEYVDSYKDFFECFNANKSSMESISPNTVRHIIQVLLSADLIFVYKDDGVLTKAIMTPLNPLFLWKYSEVFRNIKPDSTLDDDDKEALIECLNSLPNLITHLYVKDFDGDVGNNLPYCGLIKNKLPYYENNKLKGIDGVTQIPDILKRWISYAPYSKNELRIAIVDCPDILETIKCLSSFVIENKNRVIVDFYYKDSVNHTSELSFLAELDDVVNEQIEKNKIIFHIHEGLNNDDVDMKLSRNPVHIIFFFDQCSYINDFGQTEVQKTLSPLVATFDYQYDQYTKVGDIYPSTNTNMGILGAYHKFLRQNGFEESNKSPLIKMKSKNDLLLANEVLSKGYALWEVIADRNIYTYAPANAISVGEKMLNKRNMCIYANEQSRIISDFEKLLKQYNLKPKTTILVDVLKKFAHISSEGLIAIPTKKEGQSAESRRKGLIGTIFAAYLYKMLHSDSLVASLDSYEARLWISNSTDNNDRADLIALWYDDVDKNLNIDVIEVKTRDADDPDLQHATEQVTKIVTIIKNIFAQERNDIFSASRKEILKKQLVNECFRGIHDSEWQIKWDSIFKDVFRPDIENRSTKINVNGLIFHIKLNSFDDGRLVYSKYDKSVIMNIISSKDIQDYVFEKTEINRERFEKVEDFVEEIIEEQDDTQIEDVDDDELKIEHKDESVKEPTIQTKEAEPITEQDDLRKKHWDEIERLGRAFYKSCKNRNIGITKEFEKMINDTIVGSRVYRFFFKLEQGRNVSYLENQLDDIGREIKRSGLIVSSINNDDRLILDVPRLECDDVLFESIIGKFSKVNSPEKLPICIGREPNGNDVIKDISEMPHMLIGGSTGSGKTVFLHSLICSLLLTHPSSDDLKLVISSAGLEDFVYFEGLPHLLNGEIITTANDTVEVIKNIVNDEFEARKQILIDARCENIIKYNETHEQKMPPIVVVIDEFADISDQLQNKKEKESFFTVVRQIAQIGRKRGIHLVLCTQRPSATLVPTNIRALLDGRLALKVNDAPSSKMILDENGAQNLQKHGDLIFKTSSTDKIRAQGYYISTQMVDEIVAKIKK